MQCLLRRCPVSFPELNRLGQWMTRRHRNGPSKQRLKFQPRTPPPSSPLPPVENLTRPPKRFKRAARLTAQATLTIQKDRIIPFFKNNVSIWVNHPETLHRLVSFGLPPDDSKRLLNEFIREIQSDSLSDPESYIYYGLERFGHTHDSSSSSIETIYSTIFFSWASRLAPEHTPRIETDTRVFSSTISLRTTSHRNE